MSLVRARLRDRHPWTLGPPVRWRHSSLLDAFAPMPQCALLRGAAISGGMGVDKRETRSFEMCVPRRRGEIAIVQWEEGQKCQEVDSVVAQRVRRLMNTVACRPVPE